MKKILLSLATMALCSSGLMAQSLVYDMPVGSANSKSDPAYGSTTGYTSTFTYTVSEGRTFDFYGFNNNGNSNKLPWTEVIKTGRNKNAVAASVASNFAIPEQITSVELDYQVAATYTKYLSGVYLYSSADGNEWSQVAFIASADIEGNKLSTTTASYPCSTLTLSVPEAAAGLYYKLVIDMLDTNPSNGTFQVGGVRFYGIESGEVVKKPAGLSFSSDYVIGKTYMKPATLTVNNPNGLNVTYSSDSDVIKVNETTGAFSGSSMKMLAGLTATITARSEETEEFAAGEASYTVYVAQANLGGVIAATPNTGDRAALYSVLQVIWSKGGYNYVADVYDNFALVYMPGVEYEEGASLTPPFMLEYAPYYSLPEWKFVGETPKATEGVKFTPAKATSISLADVNKVLYLQKVTFAEATPTAKGQNFVGTLADGSEVTFRTAWEVEESVGPCTCTVYGAVSRYNDQLQFYPIRYSDVESSAVIETPELPSSLKASSDADQESFFFWAKEFSQSGIPMLEGELKTANDNVTVTLEVPEGWDGFMHSPVGDNGVAPARRTAEESEDATEWISVKDFESYGYVSGNTVTVDSDGSPVEVQLYLVKDGMVDTSDMYLLKLTATKLVENPDAPELPATLTASSDADESDFVFKSKTESMWGMATLDGKFKTTKDCVTVTIDVPEGWDGFMHNPTEGDDSGISPTRRIDAESADATEWISVEEFKSYGYVSGNSVTIPADGYDVEMQFYLVSNGKVNATDRYLVTLNASKISDMPELPEHLEVLYEVNGGAHIAKIVKYSVNDPEAQGVATTILTVAVENTVESVEVSLNLPDVWTPHMAGELFMTGGDSEIEPLMLRAKADHEWAPAEYIASMPGFKQTDRVTIPSDGEDYHFQVYLGLDDQVLMSTNYALQVNVKKDVTLGVEGIDAAEADAAYYTLEGVKVANPVKGVYVKVVNGVASKVVVK
ncbi:MAG: hypothetical protein K2L83_06310 [Muribaculaceae bacterium]|nr:hypothetical protein [Muribaculaceae bacterium]